MLVKMFLDHYDTHTWGRVQNFAKLPQFWPLLAAFGPWGRPRQGPKHAINASYQAPAHIRLIRLCDNINKKVGIWYEAAVATWAAVLSRHFAALAGITASKAGLDFN